MLCIFTNIFPENLRSIKQEIPSYLVLNQATECTFTIQSHSTFWTCDHATVKHSETTYTAQCLC